MHIPRTASALWPQIPGGSMVLRWPHSWVAPWLSRPAPLIHIEVSRSLEPVRHTTTLSHGFALALGISVLDYRENLCYGCDCSAPSYAADYWTHHLFEPYACSAVQCSSRSAALFRSPWLVGCRTISVDLNRTLPQATGVVRSSAHYQAPVAHSRPTSLLLRSQLPH